LGKFRNFKENLFVSWNYNSIVGDPAEAFGLAMALGQGIQMK